MRKDKEGREGQEYREPWSRDFFMGLVIIFGYIAVLVLAIYGFEYMTESAKSRAETPVAESFKAVQEEKPASPLEDPFAPEFVVIDQQEGYDIVYDKKTKVMYTVSTFSGDFCMIVEADGSPRLYEGSGK